jgi:hypothetical protein
VRSQDRFGLRLQSQYHRGVAVTPAIALGGRDQPIDLGAGQVLPRPIGRVTFLRTVKTSTISPMRPYF